MGFEQKKLQGIYTIKDVVIYVAFEPAEEILMWSRLDKGDAINGYSSMKKLPTALFIMLTPYKLGWLPNKTVVSDLFPELYI